MTRTITDPRSPAENLRLRESIAEFTEDCKNWRIPFGFQPEKIFSHYLNEFEKISPPAQKHFLPMCLQVFELDLIIMIKSRQINRIGEGWETPLVLSNSTFRELFQLLAFAATKSVEMGNLPEDFENAHLDFAEAFPGNGKYFGPSSAPVGCAGYYILRYDLLTVRRHLLGLQELDLKTFEEIAPLEMFSNRRSFSS